MKKTMRIVSLCLITVMALMLFAGCSSSEEKKFIGTWYELDEDGNKTGTTLVLAKNGEGSLSEDGFNGSVKWSVDKDKLFVTATICGMTRTSECTYEFSGDRVILTNTDGEVMTYTK